MLIHKNFPHILQVGDGARNTNYDYTGGDLDELIDIICEEKAKLFVCAIGAPPKKIVDKLHANKIVVMNMVGSVRNCEKALERGVDLICAQGTEAGGHTGDISTLCLVPQCVDLCKNKKSFFGGDVHVVGAGGIYDGRGVAAVMALGAVGAWIGTRFVCATESSAPPHHKKKIIAANSSVPIRTLTLSGRPIRLIPNKWVLETEKDKAKLDEMLREGMIVAGSRFLLCK